MSATAPRGSTPARAWLRALETTTLAARNPERILPRIAGEWAQRYGGQQALLSDRESFTYEELARRVNRISRWALANGVAKGETIALVMGNRPDYFAIWLGLTQIGAVVALINVNLTGPALAHCLEVASARRAIVEDAMSPAFDAAVAGAARRFEVWRHGGGAQRFDLA
ncbi:MAG: AMP-binding protein, partial [Hyphomicrobiales bacterium]|nr:AMP-binding protein [Hyphomicrobiales bacterium]